MVSIVARLGLLVLVAVLHLGLRVGVGDPLDRGPAGGQRRRRRDGGEHLDVEAGRRTLAS